MPQRHPCALYLLCVVELWERFAFCAVLPLLVLYLHQHRGYSENAALLLLGIFLALSYVGSLPGGYLAARIGHRVGTLLGVLLLMIGYGTVAIDRAWLLWPSFGLMVAGHALFKPGLHALIGNLYRPTDLRSEGGFLLLHCAINIGGMAGPLTAEWARGRWGWAAVFRCAVVAMIAGASVLVIGWRLLQNSVIRVTAASASAPSAAKAKEQWRALGVICSLAVIFWLTAQQAGSSLALFAEANTLQGLRIGRHSFTIKPGHFASLHSLLVLLLLPVQFGATARLRARGADPSVPSKMIGGYAATALAFGLLGAACLLGGDIKRVSPLWLSACYLLLSGAELLLAPMGVSLVARLAPPQKTSQGVGLWFAASALGNLLTGAFGWLWVRWPHHRYFALLTMLSLGAASVLMILRPRIEAAIMTTDSL